MTREDTQDAYYRNIPSNMDDIDKDLSDEVSSYYYTQIVINSESFNTTINNYDYYLSQ